MKEQDAASVCHFGLTVKNWPKCRILQLFVLAARRIRGICLRTWRARVDRRDFAYVRTAARRRCG